MNASEVTVIIPTLKSELNERALNFCIQSLKESTASRVLISYNGEGTEYPQGQCGAVNRAVKESDTKWVFISNDDMVYTPRTFAQLAYAVDHFGLLVASPNLVEPRRGAPPFLEKFCGGVGVVGGEADFDKQCFLDFAEHHKEHPNKPYLGIENGFNMPLLIRRDVWDSIGGYDESYDNPWSANSDSDLQYRIMLAGITPKRVRNALVYHFGQTSGTFHPDNKAQWEENQRRFTEKFGVVRASSPEIWYKPSLEGVTFNPEYKDLWLK